MWEVRERLMFMTWMILCFAPKEKGIFSGERRGLQPPNLWRPQESPLYIYKLLSHLCGGYLASLRLNFVLCR